MKPKFRAWFRGQLDKHKTRKNEKTSPRLPSSRPGVLTPSSSQENFPQGCLFFTRLPEELRREILLFAFGNRRVHMDLSFEHPSAIYTPGQHRTLTSTAVDPIGTYGRREEVDYKQPKCWRWWGGVCNRYLPDPGWEFPGPMGSQGPPGPWGDYCRFGCALHCDRLPADIPWKCHIGAMGWLLSCRQAYKEGIEVLYNTNTISMSSEVMITHIPELLLPQRLAAMTSLELMWPLKCHIQEGQSPVLKEGQLEVLFTLLSSQFPGLTHLYIALQTVNDLRFSRDWLDADSILKEFDQLVPQMTGLVECGIAFPLTTFEKLLKAAEDAPKTRRQSQKRISCYRYIWRFLDDGEHVLTERPNNTYPDPPSRLLEPDDKRTNIGYWVLESHYDEETILLHTISCFGGGFIP